MVAPALIIVDLMMITSFLYIYIGQRSGRKAN